MLLCHSLVLNAAPREKRYRLFDGHGLYLEVSPEGGKWWRIKSRFGGREKRLSLGIFPKVSLDTARQRCAEAREQLAESIDPAVQRKHAKRERALASNSFEAISREWYRTASRAWMASHGDRVMRRLESHVFPWIGAMPIGTVKAVDILACLRRLENQNTLETARRVLQYCGQILRYAILTERLDTDVSQHLRGLLVRRTRKHLASIRSPREVGALLRAIDGYDGRLVTRLALGLAPLVFVRPQELRYAQWDEFDFVQREWRISAERMKARIPHIVLCQLKRWRSCES